MKGKQFPHVYRKLHASLSIAAADRGCRLNPFVNGLLYRSLVCESLSDEAISVLPSYGVFNLSRECPTKPMSADGDSDSAQSSRRVLSSWAKAVSGRVVPFASIDELGLWYETSVVGVGRALASVGLRAPTRRSSNEMRDHWRYETTVLYLNQVYAHTLQYLIGNTLRSPSESSLHR